VTRVVALALAVGVALFWIFRIIPGERIILANGDLYGYFYPAYASAYALLHTGELPLWNPFQLCGLPWLATLQTGFLYPPHLVYLLLPTHRAMAVSSGAHLIFMALATAAFVRRIGLGWAPAALAALLFTCRGQVPFLLYSPAAFEAASWLPLGALASVDLARGRLRRGTILLALATGGSLLAGYPQSTLFLGYAWSTLLAVVLVTEGADWRRRFGRAVAFGGALALGALVAAAQLLPTAELTGDAVRGTRVLPLSYIYPLGTMLVANPAWGFVTRDAVARGPLALGAIALMLVPLAWARRSERAIAVWALGLGAAALVYALGPGTPLLRPLLALPGLAWFRIPTRALFLVDFCWAVLAAIGLDVLLAQRPSRAIAAIAGLAALAVLALVLAGAIAPNAGLLVVVLAAAVQLAIAFGPSTVPARHAAAVVVVALVAIDLVAAPQRGLRFPFGPAAAALIQRRRPLYDELRPRLGSDRVWIFLGVPPVDFGPKLPTLFHVRAVDDYEPLVTRRQGEFMLYFWEGATEPSRPPYSFMGYLNSLTVPPGRSGPGTRWRLFDLAAVRYVLIPPHELARPEVAAFVDEAGLVRREVILGLVVFENPTRVPRAYVTYRTLPAPDAEPLLALMSRREFDPLAASYVEGVAPAEPSADAPARGVPATIVRDDARAVEIDADLAAPGLVVLADTYYPGWEATVDGVPAPVVAVDHLFRGVRAGAGHHRVRFSYDGRTARHGIAASLAGVAVLAVVAFSRRPVPRP
jgi:hypothetical protein